MSDEPAADLGAGQGGRTRLDEVLLRATGLEGEEQESYLAEVADDDPALAGEARRRIAAIRDLPDTFLARPAAERLDEEAPDSEPTSEPATAATGPTAGTMPAAERYELGRSLGEGGMGRVVEAWDRLLDRRVALKFLVHPEASVRSLFLAEGRAQARVRHDHVLEIYDSGELGGEPFLSMRYVDGGTLDEVGDGLPLEQKVRLLVQAAEGLHAAHRQGLLHRDVKPSNILVEEDPDGEPAAYVSDFGIAADLEKAALPAGEAVAGSPYYIAPESLGGGAETIDRRADVYSLGMTLYRVLTGALPFSGPLTVDVLRQSLEAELPPPRTKLPSLPAELEAIILRCLARDPAERYASARAVAEDLQRYLDGEVVEAFAAGLAYRLTRFALRHRLLVATAAAAVVLLAVAAVAVAVFAFAADAARRRAELRQGQAEELIRFMVVDLQEKLAPVSRLAVLEDVAREAREYFAAVPAEELSETELLRHSRTLYQLGNLRIQQGDLEGAQAPMRESLALARRLAELDPGDAERLFELGQSWFWVGFVAWEQGDLDAARGPLQEYMAISRRLVEIDPENLDWQLEVSYAHSNLGSLLQAAGKLEEALEQFAESLATKAWLVKARPSSAEWRSDLADSHNTVAVALSRLNRLDEARRHLEQELAIREALLASEPENRLVQSALATAHAYLGKLEARAENLAKARRHTEAGHRLLTELAAHDPDNSITRFKLAWAHLDLGRLALADGELAAGEREWRHAEALLDQLRDTEGTAATRRARYARGALAYHFALLHWARGDSRGRGLVLSALETFETLTAEQPSDLEVTRWWGWSYLLLAALETSPAAAGAALERAVEILEPLEAPAETSALSRPQASSPPLPPCLQWARAPADAVPAAAGDIPLDPIFCGLAHRRQAG